MAAWIRPLSRWQQGRAVEFLPEMMISVAAWGKSLAGGRVRVTSAYVHGCLARVLGSRWRVD